MSDSPAAFHLPRLPTAREVAEATGLGAWRVYELCRTGDIPHIRLGRAVRFSPTQLVAWLEAGGTRDGAEGAP